MDRNAIRRKRYAEMPQNEKAALLRRRNEARAAKKRKESSRSFVRSVPLGYVETGVFFPNSSSRGDSNIQDSRNNDVTLNEMLQHRSIGYQDVLIKERLDYMTSSGAAVTNVSGPTPPSVVPIESNPLFIIPEGISSLIFPYRSAMSLSLYCYTSILPYF